MNLPASADLANAFLLGSWWFHKRPRPVFFVTLSSVFFDNRRDVPTLILAWVQPNSTAATWGLNFFFFLFLLSCGPRIVLPRSITDFQSTLRWHAYAKQFAHDDFLGDVWTATAGIVWTPAKQLDWTHLTTEHSDLYRSAIDSVAVTVSWALTIQPDVCRTCPVRIMRPNPTPHPPTACL